MKLNQEIIKKKEEMLCFCLLQNNFRGKELLFDM